MRRPFVFRRRLSSVSSLPGSIAFDLSPCSSPLLLFCTMPRDSDVMARLRGCDAARALEAMAPKTPESAQSGVSRDYARARCRLRFALSLALRRLERLIMLGLFILAHLIFRNVRVSAPNSTTRSWHSPITSVGHPAPRQELMTGGPARGRRLDRAAALNRFARHWKLRKLKRRRCRRCLPGLRPTTRWHIGTRRAANLRPATACRFGVSCEEIRGAIFPLPPAAPAAPNVRHPR